MLAKIARCTRKSRQNVIKDHWLYGQWNAMRRRCYDPDFIVYPIYGAKGVTVCDEWRTNYEAFQTWALAHGWKRGLSIDRIDGSRGYSPDNCRLATPLEQSCNRASWNIPLTIKGITKLVGHWADQNHIPRGVVYNRIRVLKWDAVKAVSTPSTRAAPTYVTINGRSNTIYGWCAELGVQRTKVYSRMRTGEDAAKIIREIIKHKENNGL